jgi:hypothetical protein
MKVRGNALGWGFTCPHIYGNGFNRIGISDQFYVDLQLWWKSAQYFHVRKFFQRHSISCGAGNQIS